MAGMHHHHRHGTDAGGRRLALAIAVNLGLTLAQVAGGLFSGSLALIADALHNLSDAVALLLAWGARRIARRPADGRMTFGYGRAEVIAAFVNLLALLLLGLWLVAEALARLVDPPPVEGWTVVLIAALALVIDTVTALLTRAMARDSLNIRAAFLHNVADALGSVAVIVAGAMVLIWDWRLADPLVTLMVAGWILWQAAAALGPVLRILMLGTPPGPGPEALRARLAGLPGVEEVHHLHLWQIDEHRSSVEAHLVIAPDRWEEAEAITAAARARLRDEFGIAHATLQAERPGACSERDRAGGAEAQPSA
ncbi:MAG: cation efflux system protein [Paracoccaceae bacterium]|nr:MAG: cation efflux system protein [Paracoccaceae bacterium]